MTEIDFAALRSQASDLADAAPDVPEADAPIPAAVPVVAPTTAAPGVDTAIPKVTPTELEDLDPETSGDRKVRIKVDGEWQTVSLKEAAAGYSRTSAYTKRMQDLATQRQDVETRTAAFQRDTQELQNLRNFARNPQQILQYLQQTAPQLFQQPQQPVGQPDEIATIQQANDLVERKVGTVLQQLQKMEQDMAGRLQANDLKIRNDAETARFSEHLNATVKQIFTDNPILNKVRNAEDNIRYEVSKLKPTTIQEAAEAFHTVARGMVEDLEEGFASLNKTKVVAAAKLATRRIEPPGGSGPQLQPTNYKNAQGKLDWNKLKEAAANFPDQG